MPNNRINNGLAKAAPLCYASFASRLCGALGLQIWYGKEGLGSIHGLCRI
jgi:hypothetical protein